MIEDRILDFLDGRLSGADEEELLHTLAVSPERRAMLKQHMALRELTTDLSKEARFAVPCDTTAALFQKLTAEGYSGPGAFLPAPPVQPLIPQIVQTPLRFRLLSLVSSSVVSFILGLTVFYLASPTTSHDTELPYLANQGAVTFTIEEPGGSPARTTLRSVPTRSRNIAVPASIAEVAPVKRTIHEPSGLSLESVPEALMPSLDIAGAVLMEQKADKAIADNSIQEPQSVETPDIPKNSVPGIVDNAVKLPIEKAPVQNTPEPAQINAPVAENNSGSMKPFDRVIRQADIIPPTLVPDQYFEIAHTSIRDLTEDDKDDGTGLGLKFGFRVGAGYAPGSSRVMSGWLGLGTTTLRYEWLSAKFSYGQFAPYELEVYDPNPFPTLIRTLDFLPTLKFKNVMGIDLGVMLHPYENLPVEVTAGALRDVKSGTIFPHGSMMATLDLSRRLQLQVGLEGVLYTIDTRKIIEAKHEQFKNDVLVILHRPGNAISGFIGPSFDLSFRF